MMFSEHIKEQHQMFFSAQQSKEGCYNLLGERAKL